MNKLDRYNKYYLYLHIRLDKNHPFYVGVGTKHFRTKPKKGRNTIDLSINTIYQRAFDKTNRNNLWLKIAKKTKYKVEILMESSDYDFIKEKEKELIAFYGRINTNNGILANLTNGGEGELGRLSGIPVFMYDLFTGAFIKEFRNAYKAAQELNCYPAYIETASKSKYIKSVKGYLFRRYKADKIIIPDNSFHISTINNKIKIKTKHKVLWT